MTLRTMITLGVTAALLVLVGAVVALTRSDDDDLSSPARAVADLDRVSDFSFGGAAESCVFDADRGGLVIDDLTISSKSTGILQMTFYVQRESLDDVLPGYTSTVLSFGKDARSRTFDVVIPVTRADYEAGYDECQWSTGGV